MSEQLIFDVTEEDFAIRVVERSHEVLVMVDFWAAWCGPCQMLTPVLTKLAESYDGGFVLAKVDIDAQRDLAAQFGIRSVPTVKLFKDGGLVDEFLGLLPESEIRQRVDRYVTRKSDREMEAVLDRFAEDEVEETIAALRYIQESDPDNPRVRQRLLELLVKHGQLAEATALLEALPYAERDSPALSALKTRLSFAATTEGAPDLACLEQQVARDPRDSEARYQLSARYVLEGDFEAAMDQLLEILKRDRAYGDDAARKGLVKVFELLGDEGELVSRYRSRMSAALY